MAACICESKYLQEEMQRCLQGNCYNKQEIERVIHQRNIKKNQQNVN